jgi:hypothetical protein
MFNQSQPKPVWAGCPMRLDPDHLPQVACYASRSDTGEVTITIDRRGAILRRRLARSGLPATIMLPAHVFRGVAARAIEDDAGEVTVTLELHHSDPSLCVPLLVAGDAADVAGDWRAWAELFNLPMLLIEGDGRARTLDESLERCYGDRPRRPIPVRGPRFRMRAGAAGLGIRLTLAGRKIL